MARHHKVPVKVVHDTTLVHDTTVVRDTVRDTTVSAVAVHDTVHDAAHSPPQSPMTLDALLTFLGLMLAIVALAGPTQRRALSILLPLRQMLIRLMIVTGLLVIPHLIRS